MNLPLLILVGANSCFASMLIKRSQLGECPTPTLLSPWFLSGCALAFANSVLFAKVLQRMPVSLAYPAQAAISFVLLSVLSRWLLHESVSLAQCIGIASIVLGLFLLSSP